MDTGKEVILKRRPLWKRILSLPRHFWMQYHCFRTYGNSILDAIRIAFKLSLELLKTPKHNSNSTSDQSSSGGKTSSSDFLKSLSRQVTENDERLTSGEIRITKPNGFDHESQSKIT